MARRSPAEKLERILTVIRAWQALAPRESFSGMSLAQFKTAVRPSIAARKDIADLQQRIRIKIQRRDTSDTRSFELITRLGFAVKGDPAHGRDSALCSAIGYTRETERRSRIRRGMRKKRRSS
jgi:hypothetical protein